jgi:hypothetical protein
MRSTQLLGFKLKSLQVKHEYIISNERIKQKLEVKIKTKIISIFKFSCKNEKINVIVNHSNS